MKEIEVDHFGLHIGGLSCGVSREAVEKGPKAPRRAKIGNAPSPMRASWVSLSHPLTLCISFYLLYARI
jgi:hypothetical protein